MVIIIIIIFFATLNYNISQDVLGTRIVHLVATSEVVKRQGKK